MINDENIKKSKPIPDEQLQLKSTDIYNLHLESKRIIIFKPKYQFVINVLMIMFILITLSFVVGKNLTNLRNNEKNPSDSLGNDISLSEEQKIRKSKYIEGNKNNYVQRLRQITSNSKLEEKDYQEYITAQDLKDVDYYFEVKVDYQVSTMKNKTIIVKKGELFYPSLINEDNKYMYKSGYTFDGWVINEDKTNIIDEAIPIESDCTFRASWCKRNKYSTSVFSCSYYIKENNKVVLFDGKLLNENKLLTELVLPDSIDGYPVSEIASATFSQSQTLVNENVIDPGNENFKTLMLPSSLEKIGIFAFERFVALEKIYIGEKLSLIVGGAFSECNKIKEIIVDPKNQEMVFEKNCLYNKVTKTLFYAKNAIELPTEVKTISEYAFSENHVVKSLDFSNIENIKNKAFYECNYLSEITNFEKLVYIGSYAFYKCENLLYFEILNNVKYLGVNPFAYCYNITFTVENNNFKLIDDCVIDSKNSMIVVGMKDKVADCEIIGKSAFQGNRKIKEIIFPSNTKEIGASAYQDAISLSKVIINDNIKIIGDESFKGCSSLEDLILPMNVDYLGAYSFSYCTSLKEIAIPNNLEIIPYGICSECSKLEKVYLSTKSKIVDDLAFSWCTSLKYVYGFEQIIEFGFCSFTHTKLNEFNFSTENITIDVGAFRCSTAKVIHIPLNVKSIGSTAFSNSSSIIILEGSRDDYSLGNMWDNDCIVYENIGIDKLYVDDNYLLIEENGKYTLVNYLCSDKRVEIPSVINDIPVTKLAGNIFKDNQIIEEVVLGENIIEIDKEAFRNSTLKKIIFNNKLEKIGDLAFFNTYIEKIIIPNSVLEIGESAFQENKYLKEIIVSDNLKVLPSQMLCDCPLLEYIYLGDGLEEISLYAIYKCPNLKFLRVGPNLKSYLYIHRAHTIDLPSEVLVLGNISKKDDGSCANEMINIKVYFEETLDMSIFTDNYLYTKNGEIVEYYLYNEWEYVDGYPVIK